MAGRVPDEFGQIAADAADRIEGLLVADLPSWPGSPADVPELALWASHLSDAREAVNTITQAIDAMETELDRVARAG